MGGSRQPIQNSGRGFTFTKSFGQHILKSQRIADQIVQAASLRASDDVLEVGPGTGMLTQYIIPRARSCRAIEYDRRMVQELQKRFRDEMHEGRLSITHGDAVRVEFGHFDVCISNTPYQISSPLVMKLLAHRPMFRCAVLMFQLEFAQRLVAQPGSPLYCRLSVNTQLLANVRYLFRVSKTHFRPPPKVESAVVIIEPFNPPPPIRYMEWDGMLQICFTRKNKTLKANFKTKTVISMLHQNATTFAALNGRPQPTVEEVEETVESVLVDTRWDGQRASKLDKDSFLELLLEFNEAGIHFS